MLRLRQVSRINENNRQEKKSLNMCLTFDQFVMERKLLPSFGRRPEVLSGKMRKKPLLLLCLSFKSLLIYVE